MEFDCGRDVDYHLKHEDRTTLCRSEWNARSEGPAIEFAVVEQSGSGSKIAAKCLVSASACTRLDDETKCAATMHIITSNT